jgi:hypothetical protein
VYTCHRFGPLYLWYPAAMRIWAAMILVVGCNSGPPSTTASSGAPATTLEEGTAADNAPVRELVCSKANKRLGTLRFPEGGAPTLTLEAQGADGDELKAAWEKLLARGKLQAKVHEGQDDERPLIGIQAGPGDARYGRVVEIRMLDDYGFDCRK